MSLFDVIKYKDTDLNNGIKLFQLPEDLINNFWIESHTILQVQNIGEKYSHRIKCSIFAAWKDERKHKIFIKVLNDYNSNN